MAATSSHWLDNTLSKHINQRVCVCMHVCVCVWVCVCVCVHVCMYLCANACVCGYTHAWANTTELVRISFQITTRNNQIFPIKINRQYKINWPLTRWFSLVTSHQFFDYNIHSEFHSKPHQDITSAPSMAFTIQQHSSCCNNEGDSPK